MNAHTDSFPPPSLKNKACSKCQTSFICGDMDGKCWCNAYPAIVEMDPINDCLCPQCLHKNVAKKIDAFVDSLTLDHLQECNLQKYKGKEPVEGIDFYINTNGLFVFTKWYHLVRGSCCKNKCIHCPYGFKKQS